MGEFFWDTKVYVSHGSKEVSFIQTWFDDNKILSKQNVIMTFKELKKIIESIESDQ
jgi:hypothetical protein